MVNVEQVAVSVTAVDFWYFPIAAGIYGLIQMLSAVRWWILSPNVSFKKIVGVTFSAQFLMFLIPSGLAGDALRVYSFKSEKESLADHIAAVLLDKYVLVMVTLLFFGCSLLWVKPSAVIGKDYELLSVTCLTSGLVGLVALFADQTDRLLECFFGLVVNRLKLGGNRLSYVEQSLESFKELRKKRSRIIVNAVIGIVLLCVSAAAYLFLGFALEMDISLSQCCFTALLMQFLLIVPIGFAGVGLKELSFVMVFGAFGVSKEAAITASLVSYPIVVFYAIFGWLLYLHQTKRHW